LHLKREAKEMRILLIGIIVLGMTAVYEPGSIIPKYFIDETPHGEHYATTANKS